MRRVLVVAGAAVVLASSQQGALADVDPLSGVDFVTVGSVNNPAWQGNGDPDDQAIGRGSVGYEYRIGKYEITTANWVEFMNAAFDRPSNDLIPFVGTPFSWGAIGTTTVPSKSSALRGLRCRA